MKGPQEGYLKCYYGYKNFGDEILVFGVINRIFTAYPTIEKLYIEVGDKERFDSRIDKNRHYLDVSLCKLESIQKDNYRKVLAKGLCNPKALKFLGGGEIFTEARGWFHGGRNYYLLFWRDFLVKNIVLLGGFGTPTLPRSKLLYRLTLKNCQKIIVRESASAKVVASYLGNRQELLVKHDDFSTDVVKKWQHRQNNIKTALDKQDRMLINLTPYRHTETDLEAIRLSVDVWGHCQHVYFPCGQEDVDILGQLMVITPSIVAYYRRNNDIDNILTYMSTSSSAVGSRLHFLFILHLLGVAAKPIIYQEKIQKFLDEYGMTQ